jgi:hypothetical protein
MTFPAVAFSMIAFVLGELCSLYEENPAGLAGAVSLSAFVMSGLPSLAWSRFAGPGSRTLRSSWRHEGRIRMLMMLNGFWQRSVIALACGLAACVDRSSAAPEPLESDICVVAEGPKPLTDLPEASGLTLSRRTPGVLWSHNDSGQPVLFAFDTSGRPRGRVRLPNAAVEDWEDVTAAPCPAGNCLYVADIGDNNLERRRMTVYRIPEPQAEDGESANVETFTAVYPDGPHDAEALFVATEDMYIITKDASAALYRFPKPLRAGTDMTLERVAELPLRRVTDAEVSADGAWVAVRTTDEVAFYRGADIVRGGSPSAIVSLRPLNEPQGEGVALDANGMLYLTSEAGGGRRAGSLTTLRCTLPK